MGLIVGPSSTIRKPEDLKGAKIGVTTNGSLTYWLARELSRQMGWGSEGIETVALGQISAQFAALKRGQVDEFIMSSSQGYGLEEKKKDACCSSSAPTSRTFIRTSFLHRAT